MPDDTARAEDWAAAHNKVLAHDAAGLPAIMARADWGAERLSPFALACEQILALVRRSVRADRNFAALENRVTATERRIAELDADRASARRIILPGDGR